MNNWDLDNPFNFSRYLLDHLHNLSYNFLNFFDLVFNYNLFSNHLNFLNSGLSVNDLNDLLNNLWDFNNSLYILDNWNRLLYNSLDDLMLNFNMVQNFSGIPVLDNRDQFFNYLFYFNYLRDLNDSFDNLFHNNWYLNNLLNNLFHGHNLFLDNLDLFILFLYVVDNSFHLDNSLNFNNLLFNSLNFNNFWDFFLYLYESFNNGWYFDNSLYSISQGNDLIDSPVINYGLFKWNINNFFDFSNLFDLNDLLNYFVNSDDLRYFHNFLDHFLNNFLDFDDLGDYSENFKNIIHTYNTHYLLPDHANNAFIHFGYGSCLGLNLLQFLKQSLDKNS